MAPVLDFNTPPRTARESFRHDTWRRPTTGLCTGFYQANLCILPGELAEDFAAFCAANPQPLPLLERTTPGDPTLRCAQGADLRTDAPLYRVYRDGHAVGDVPDIVDLWREDFVGFVLGCSFSAEEELLRAGVRLRHLDNGSGVPIYRTNIRCVPAGVFRGPLVVSMRPIRRDQLDAAATVTGRLPLAHGAPAHIGDPHEIGIVDIEHPDWGVPIEIADDEVPVFWACGVTPQAAIAEVRPPLAITHAPGCMFVTDIPVG